MRTRNKVVLFILCSAPFTLAFIDWACFQGAGFPPPHLKVPGLFAPGPTLPGTVALVVNGGLSPAKNHSRYWNNTSLVAATLKARGFERVAVLQSDGLDPAPDRQTRSFMGVVGTGTVVDSLTDVDGDGTVDVVGPSTRDSFERTLLELGRAMHEGSRLLIVLTDHGQLRLKGSRVSAVAMLWGSELTGVDFDKLLRAAVPDSCWVAVVATQCHSGLFLGEVTRPRTLLCAAGWPLWIWSTQDYSVFPYHLCGALLGRDPATGAQLPEGAASTLRQAFDAAYGRDRAPEWPIRWANGPAAEAPAPF